VRFKPIHPEEDMTDLRAVVVGTGMMGPGIAATLAAGGIGTCLVSRKDESANEGLLQARTLSSTLEKQGLLSSAQLETALRCLSCSTDLDAQVANADLVVESIPEDLALKQRFFQRLASVSGKKTILASNTSGISISAIAEGSEHPDRILTTHFWNPPYLMPLVEVVMGRQTSEAVAQQTIDILKHCGKTPVLVRKDTPGQLGNRLQHALVREAVHIIHEGIATAEDVDLAVKNGFGLRLPVWGVLEHADAVGLDLVKAVQDYVLPALRSETHADPLLTQKVEEGTLGAKTGRGFYDWTVRDMGAAKARRDEFLVRFLRDSKSVR
jgi:3-hydroxybutyryl-CoA dehydrogenase